jgi:hypothetical protein
MMIRASLSELLFGFDSSAISHFNNSQSKSMFFVAHWDYDVSGNH